MPFIVICLLHYIDIVDANQWYSVFSMVVLPINSVINPLLYNDFIMRNAATLLSRTNSTISNFASSVRSRIRSSGSDSEENSVTQNRFEMRDSTSQTLIKQPGNSAIHSTTVAV
jgi:hypothetical protein